MEVDIVTQDSVPQEGTTRRAALAGVGLAGLAAALTACGASGGSGSGSAQSSGSGSGGGSGGAGSGGGTGTGALASTGEIPVGGGTVFSAEKVVVTQPSAGKFKAFSAVCTHEQCLVDRVANGTIDCPCHGSEFSVKNGSVVSGPAPSPLPRKSITVAGGKITLA
jgi:nitrite reductase/ring-hydroxylating ferredoxin subunit